VNYGTLVITDGVFQPSLPPPSQGRMGLVRMDGALAPTSLSQKPGGTTFVVELNYNDNARLYVSGKSPAATRIPVGYSKTYTRVSPGGSPLRAATEFVSKYAGCDEAHKVRRRAIALSRIHKTISGETFRFHLEAL